jgi:hypothetical protein
LTFSSIALKLIALNRAPASVTLPEGNNLVKTQDKVYALISGTLLLLAAVIIYLKTFSKTFSGTIENNELILLSAIVLVGLALTVIFMAILGIIYSAMGITNREQALGLPEGSVRALLAFSLVLVFVCMAGFLFGEVDENKGSVEGKTLVRVTEAELSNLKANFVVASELAKDEKGKFVYEQILDPNDRAKKATIDDLKHPIYAATYYPKANKDAVDFAKQIFTTLATIFVSVVSFYFGSSVTTSAAAAGAKAAQGTDGDPKIARLRAALTDALADSHNAQATVDRATQALNAAQAESSKQPADPQKLAAVQTAQKALDDAKKDLQNKQKKVEDAQQALNAANPSAGNVKAN